MRSPFPGMDPFLEDPTTWSDFHARLIPVLSDLLTERVAPHFFVRIDTRVYTVAFDDPEERLLEVHERYLEVHDSRRREVVATIEVLSPANKMPGSTGRASFRQRRRALMMSPVHWLEIDLLRAGERPAEVADQSDYYVLLKRGDVRESLAVWPIDFRDRLPTVAVPLRPPIDDVPLDLQTALDTVYERAHYAASIDYSDPVPGPRLAPADAAWVEERIRQWTATE